MKIWIQEGKKLLDYFPDFFGFSRYRCYYLHTPEFQCLLYAGFLIVIYSITSKIVPVSKKLSSFLAILLYYNFLLILGNINVMAKIPQIKQCMKGFGPQYKGWAKKNKATWNLEILLIQNVEAYNPETSPTCLSDQINRLMNFQRPRLPCFGLRAFQSFRRPRIFFAHP